MEYDCSTSVAQEMEGKKTKKFSYLHGNDLAQQFVKNVYAYFQEYHPYLSALQETTKALQLSEPTVRMYKDGPVANRTKLIRKRPRPKTDELPRGQLVEIREEVYNMYAAREPVTIKTLHGRLILKQKYNGSCSSVRKILTKLGFEYKKDDNRRALMEKPVIAEKRRRFLTSYIENEQLGLGKKPYVFLDETWIFANGSIRKSWQDDSVKSVKKETGEGYRYIVLHAGNENGFIEGAKLIFKSKLRTGDYHGEMNAKNFEKWMKESLLPSLEEPSIIILDNASYHSRELEKWPTKQWTKLDLMEWLEKKGIGHSATDTVHTLWKHIENLERPKKKFVIDELIREAGHEVLRLPPYHCHFNAIEMVWSQAKRFYDQLVLKTKDVTEAWRVALDSISKEQWSHYVGHTDKVIRAAWEKEKYIVSNPQPLIINIDDSDSD